ncbi:ABC transporter permease [Streptomyces sp. NPDC058391]|uniref:ABC transporter permease n=1 Tax=unclassified Streptomyces TaxID=2593676 RepID=UPI00364B891A
MRPSRLAFRDLLSEAVAGTLQRPARSVLTAMGTVLGVGTFVAVLGLTATTSSQIDGRFTVLAATEVTVEDTGAAEDPFGRSSFPPDAAARIEALNGVRHAGVYWTPALGKEVTIRSSLAQQAGSGEQAQIVAASAGVLAAAEPTLAQGRTFDSFHDRTAQRVAVIGSGLALRLGVTTTENRPAIFLGNDAFTVIGIVSEVNRKADLLMSVVVPARTAEQIWGAPRGEVTAKMLISTDVGAAPQIADETALSLSPVRPDHFKVIPPPDPKSLRTAVTADLNQLFLLLAGVCLIIGAVGIANTTLVAVLERTGEIGLRRALGARGRHITGQFLAESAALGALGGLLGTSLGTITVVAVAAAREWTPVIHPVTVAAAPAVGLATGLLAGLYPAWRASRIQPAEALRR